MWRLFCFVIWAATINVRGAHKQTKKVVRNYTVKKSFTASSPACTLHPKLELYPNYSTTEELVKPNSRILSLEPNDIKVFILVSCRFSQPNSRPFLMASINGDVRLSTDVKLVTRVDITSIYEVSFNIFKDIVGTIELSVRYWRSYQTFTRNACNAKADSGWPGKYQDHVIGSPLHIIVAHSGNRFAHKQEDDKCNSKYMPSLGAWVKLPTEYTFLNNNLLFNPKNIILTGSEECEPMKTSTSNQSLKCHHQQVTKNVLCKHKNITLEECDEFYINLLLRKKNKEEVFKYEWKPQGCHLNDFSLDEFVNVLMEKLNKKQHTNIVMNFVGDSTMYYMCKTWATLLSNHTMRSSAKKFSSTTKEEEVNERTYEYHTSSSVHSSVKIHCHHKHHDPTSSGEYTFLKKELRYQTIQAGNGTKTTPIDDEKGALRISIIGDSNAHSICGEKFSVYADTRGMIKLAKVLTTNPLYHIVWIGPVSIARSYALKSKQVHGDQSLLWRNAAKEGDNFHGRLSIIDQWHLTQPLAMEQAGDGLHYHSFLPRKDLSNPDHFKYQISGPVVVYVLKMMANALVAQDHFISD